MKRPFFAQALSVGILSMVVPFTGCRPAAEPTTSQNRDAEQARSAAAPSPPATSDPVGTPPAITPAAPVPAAAPSPETTPSSQGTPDASAAVQPRAADNRPTDAAPPTATALPTATAPPATPPAAGSLAESLTAAESQKDAQPAKSPDQVLEELGYVSPSKVVQKTLADPPGTTRLGRESSLWVDVDQKRVIIDGYVAQREAYLEMFACPAETKEHESIVGAIAKSHEVHAALLAVGAEAGKTVQFQPTYLAATGPRVRVWVMWRDADGKVLTADARSWVRRTGTQDQLDKDWVFAGSTWWKDPEDGKEYYQADSGELICVSNFGTAMMDLPIESSDSTGMLQFEAFKERIPPQGTPVRLVLVPLAPDAPNDDPRATTPPDPALMPLQESAAPLKTEGAAKPEVPATPADPAEEKPN
jgi:hypothetical protein